MTPVQSALAQLREFGQTLLHRRAAAAAALVIALFVSAWVVVLTPRIYRAGTNVLIVNGNTRNDPTLSSPDIPALATSTSVLTQVDHRVGLHIPLQVLKKNVSVKPPAYKSSLMRIEYSDRMSDQAALIANAVADELATSYNRLSTTRFDDDLHSLDAELAKQKIRIAELDKRMKLAERGRVSGTMRERPDGSNESGSVMTERSIANSKLQADIAEAQVGIDEQTLSFIGRREILQSDALYRSLQSSLDAATVDLATAKARFTSANPSLVPLRSRVTSLTAQLAAEKLRALASPDAYSSSRIAAQLDKHKVRVTVEADRRKVVALDEELAQAAHQEATQAPIDLLRLEREAAMNEYRSIASHRESTLVDRADALSLGSVVVVDRALGSQAQAVGIGPQKLAGVLFVLSLIIAIAVAMLSEQLDPRVLRSPQLENRYEKQVVATFEKLR